MKEELVKEVSLKYIEEVVKEVTGVKDLIKINRKPVLVNSRFLFFYFATKYTTKGCRVIGQYFNKDHSTVLHGNKQVEHVLKHDDFYSKWFFKIDLMIKTKHNEINCIDKDSLNLTTDGLKKIFEQDKKIERLELELFVAKQKQKYTSKKYQKMEEYLNLIPLDKIEMFCETRIEPFVKMYGDKC